MNWLSQHVGEAAALGAASCWCITSLAFAAAARRIGATAVNLVRIWLALAILLAVHRAVVGTWLPPVDSTGLWLLAASGLVGFAIGDQCLFVSLVDVGPRLTTLLMTLTPPVAAALAWPVLDEPLGLIEALGIAITIAGIAWVAMERPDPTIRRPQPHWVRGLVLGAVAAICQAAGLILSKVGIGHTRFDSAEHLDPWSASLVRLAFAALGIALLAAVRRAGRSAAATGSTMQFGVEPDHLAALRRERSPVPTALVMLAIGTVLGPVVGVWFSLVAIDRSPAGIAATLMSMTPVLILPLAVWIEKERLSWRAVAGAAVAVGGVAILTMADS